MSAIADKARFKENISKIIAQFSTPRIEQFVGASPRPTLEHVTRRHFVDPFLDALGWDLSLLDEEMIEEARTRGETTLRLDYLGVNTQTRAPVLIVEAKAWTAPFIGPSAKQGRFESRDMDRPNPISLICAAIEHCKAGGELKDSPVTGEWANYLAKLLKYVTSIKNESGHVVTRVAILSGQWLVIFQDPKAIFLKPGRVNDLLIKVYRRQELVVCAEKIFEYLARTHITDAIPSRIRPSLLPAYSRGTDLKRAYRALWISEKITGAPWKRRPNLDIYVAMVLERRDGVLITVIDESLQENSMPHEYDQLSMHIAAVEEQSDELLRRVNHELRSTLVPTNVNEFPGFRTVDTIGNPNSTSPGSYLRIELIQIAKEPGEFLLVTGTIKHFLLETPTVSSCMYHDWSSCQGQAQEQGSSPIVSRSVDPKAFFMTAEQHHCAHRVIHDRRDARCQIDAFEEFLCCRACALQTFCWDEQELTTLPCGIGPQVAAASIV
ncbi:MAG: hypothetical protein OXQ89_04130 [Rhodospirillaceae bacterium]|nr:hypothetical protein [Rhodospirillaceae bacterium]